MFCAYYQFYELINVVHTVSSLDNIFFMNVFAYIKYQIVAMLVVVVGENVG